MNNQYDILLDDPASGCVLVYPDGETSYEMDFITYNQALEHIGKLERAGFEPISAATEATRELIRVAVDWQRMKRSKISDDEVR
jgi:hypothetical protein